MLSAPARNASAMPRPITISGTARTSVAEVKAYHEPERALPERRQRGRRVVAGELQAGGEHGEPEQDREHRRPSGHRSPSARRPARGAAPPGTSSSDAPGRHQHRCGEGEHFVQVARVDEHGRAGGRGRSQPARESRRSPGCPARGSDSPPRSPVARRASSRARTTFCWLPPLKRRGGRVGPVGATTPYSSKQRRRPRPRHLPVEPAPPYPRIVRARSRARRSR